ncbi:MAG: ABC transporter permease subunit [bacterium]|nr:ABC transporter permease subunit [bacterium]
MSTAVAKKKKMSFGKRLKREFPFHLMLLPGLILTFVFKYIPMGGLCIAFQDYSPVYGLFDQYWVGLDNFRYVFSMSTFPRVIYNTMFIAILKIIAGIIVPVSFALLLNEVRQTTYKRTLQTIVYLPHFISWVALAGIFLDVLSMDGVINMALTKLGMDPVYFLGDEKVFPYTMVVTDVWKTFGWNTIVYLAAITGVDPSLYEAAYLDGAGRVRQTIHVTIPTIMPIVMLMTILSIGNVLRAGFDQIFNLYSPLVYSTGDIIDTFVYRMGILSAQFGPATAVGLFQSLVSFVLIMGGYWLADKVAGYRVF